MVLLLIWNYGMWNFCFYDPNHLHWCLAANLRMSIYNGARRGPKVGPKYFLDNFVKRPIKPLGKIWNKNTKNEKIFILLRVRNCVWPNFPITNLILLTAFHKFARSSRPNTSAFGEFEWIVGGWGWCWYENMECESFVFMTLTTKSGFEWIVGWGWSALPVVDDARRIADKKCHWPDTGSS